MPCLFQGKPRIIFCIQQQYVTAIQPCQKINRLLSINNATRYSDLKKKVRFCLFVSWRRTGGTEVQIRSFSTSALHGGQWVAAPTPVCFIPGGEVVGTPWVGGWFGPQSRSWRFGWKTSLLSVSGFELPIVQRVAKSLYRQGYPSWTISVNHYRLLSINAVTADCYRHAPLMSSFRGPFCIPTADQALVLVLTVLPSGCVMLYLIPNCNLVSIVLQAVALELGHVVLQGLTPSFLGATQKNDGKLGGHSSFWVGYRKFPAE